MNIETGNTLRVLVCPETKLPPNKTCPKTEEAVFPWLDYPVVSCYVDHKLDVLEKA